MHSLETGTHFSTKTTASGPPTQVYIEASWAAEVTEQSLGRLGFWVANIIGVVR